jgi:Zn-dependent M28 family amino/carboxypeptidase
LRIRIASIVAAALALGAIAAAPVDSPPHPETTGSLNTADLNARVRAIADNRFEGRGPGTPAGERAAQWIADEMKRIGLKPGNKGSYFQTVPAVTITLDAAKSSLSIAGPDGDKRLAFADEAVWWTPRYEQQDVRIDRAPLVFAGYGVVAPEESWNDYAGLDVKGKIVVVLINDPGFLTKDETLFKGRTMTYYGRWTYKFEEAARQGAAGVIIVHETEPAAYGWQVVRNSNAGGLSYLDAPDKNASMIPLRAWITHESAQALFRRAGLDYDEVKLAANRRGFKGAALGQLSVSASMHSTVSRITTRNIVGVVEGRTHPDEYLLYTAHWDHLGEKSDLPGPDKIYNGAIDNGIGVSSILEIAEAFVQTDTPPARSVAFLCWTLEEQGLLGSEYFAKNPLWPLKNIVAGINQDGTLPQGGARDMVIVGSGASELEDIFAQVLRSQNRVITPDPEPEKGFFYRSDHISLAKVGVPMIYPDGGFDLRAGGTAAGLAVKKRYLENFYHQPSDEFDPSWNMSGPLDDAIILFAFGERLANSELWPNWREGNEFRRIRDSSRAGN